MLAGIRRSRVTIAVVVCTFTAASVAAYQVYNAVCAQESAAQRALLSHARFAAWTFARESNAELERAARRVLGPTVALAAGHSSAAVTSPSLIVAEGIRTARRCACVAVPDVRFTFAVDLSRGGAVIGAVGDEMPETPAVNTEQAIIAHVRHGIAAGAVVGDPVIDRLSTDGTLAIAYMLAGTPGAAGTPHMAYGYAFDVASAGRAVFPTVLASRALLPPITAGALPADSALTLAVAGTDARVIFRSAATRALRPAATLGMTGAFEGFSVRVAMRPAFATRVAVGNWTWNRSQLVLGLITLSAGLVIVSLLQLHRERQLARVKSELVSGVSHELRTPLAQIRMFAEMLRLGWVRSDDERQRSVAIIDQEARRLTHLVENILQFSRAERSIPQLSLTAIDLASLVNEVVESFAPLAGTRGVTVTTSHIGQPIARADRDALRQVLLNLLDNAVKYGPAGQTITVGTRVAPDGRAQLSVDDQGAGIPARDKARVWEPFRRLDRAVEAGISGNGIGLAVVRELVVAQGGTVVVHDAPGGGASFVVTLRPGSAPAQDEARAPVRSSFTTPPSAHSLTQ
ncbi:MAG TPA: HAMP domain-containing sensor histidine kinase [Gemmatimonadaceae bacterium]|nr:HAMP domain-containing sensor histidine kinase [Gemmatimonadaceae bacterium]